MKYRRLKEGEIVTKDVHFSWRKEASLNGAGWSKIGPSDPSIGLPFSPGDRMCPHMKVPIKTNREKTLKAF